MWNFLTLAAVAIAASSPVAQPRLLLNPEDFTRIDRLAAAHAWAADARDTVVVAADGFPKSHLDRFGLEQLELPPDGGQWSLWYVCPVHGVKLEYHPPATHRCPVDRQTYTGWPYDQVIFERRHVELANAARDTALAWRLTGQRSYAETAAGILVRYADRYGGYPLKDKDNRADTRGAARVTAQTLDESIWLIAMAWAYDLLAGTDVLDSAQREHIENDLLRAAVAVIQRNDAGIGNWQSWHNAGIGAVGFALQDPKLIEQVIDGKSGFRFQMKNALLGEGFWHEGSWAYHFYALDALLQLAEMAARSGVDLYTNSGLAAMFSTPLRLAFPDGGLPAFNDSRPVNPSAYARLYEIAYARYRDPRFAAVAAKQKRRRNALLWGAPELPATGLSPRRSEIFTDSGYAVLRAPAGDHTVIMKFGPHGGGHGHYDKLGLISFALGGVLGLDPGTQSYAAPTHHTWDKVSVAHNTVVVDERSQTKATGKLLWYSFGGGFSAVSAAAGPAYPTASLERTLLVTAEYALDSFYVRATDGVARQFDWVYHNQGTTKTELPLAPYDRFPATNGYQHLTDNSAAETDQDWQIRFEGTTDSTARGLRVWMLAEPGTTVVTGNGLGSDLLTPVPYVMARRNAVETRFVSLLEPSGDRPRISAFRRLAADSYQVTGQDFEDRFTLTGKGVTGYRRSQPTPPMP